MRQTESIDTTSTPINTPIGVACLGSISPSPLRPLPLATTTFDVPSIDSLLAASTTPNAADASPFTKPEDVPLPLLSPSHVELPTSDGFVGTPRPYTLRTDNGVTALLLLCVFLIAHSVASSRHHIGESLKSFFRSLPVTSNRTERTGSEIRGRLLLLFEVSFCCGLFFYNYIHFAHREDSIVNLPYVTIGLTTGIVFLYIGLKMSLYALVNSVFFNRARAELWKDAYILIYLFVGIFLLPVTLTVVYFDYPIEQQIPAFISIIAIAKLLLLYRLFRIFCGKILDALHIFLYFCTLELVPMLVLWRGLFWFNTNMSEIL